MEQGNGSARRSRGWWPYSQRRDWLRWLEAKREELSQLEDEAEVIPFPVQLELEVAA